MPRIHTVAQDSLITASDKLIGSDGAQNNGFVTRNYSVGGIKNFVLDGTHAGSFTTITSSGNGTIGADLSVAGNLAVTGNATISGNLTFGDADTDTVSFSADVNSHVIPDITNTYDLGASDKIWRNIYADNVEGYLKTADAATTYLALAGGTLTGGLIGTTATFTGDIQLGNETTDAASEIKAYGELGLRADSDNDTGYTWGVELFRTRFGNAGGTAIQFNVNQYSNGTSGNLLDSNTIFDTIEVGDVIYGLGGGSNYQSNTDETVASVNGFYNASSQFLSATDSTGAAYFQVTMSAPVSYQSSAHLTVLPAGETFVSGGGGSSIKFYADTTTIGTLNESSFSIPGKATIGAFTIPNTIGSAQQVLRVPSSGTELEWGSNIDPLEIGPHAAVGKGSYTVYANNSVLSSTQKDYGLSIVADADSNGHGYVSLNLGTKNNVDGVQIAYNKNSYPQFTLGMGGTNIITILASTGFATFQKGLSVASGYHLGASLTYFENVNIGPSNSRYTLVNARPSSDNKFLKYTTNGQTEWATVTAADTIGTLSVTPMSGADDFKVLIDGNSAGISVLSNNGTSGSSSVVVGKDGQINAGIFEYQKANSAVRIQRHGGVVVTFDAIGTKLSLPTYADDTAAGAGGLTTGYLYKTATGEIRVKV